MVMHVGVYCFAQSRCQRKFSKKLTRHSFTFLKVRNTAQISHMAKMRMISRATV